MTSNQGTDKLLQFCENCIVLVKGVCVGGGRKEALSTVLRIENHICLNLLRICSTNNCAQSHTHRLYILILIIYMGGFGSQTLISLL